MQRQGFRMSIKVRGIHADDLEMIMRWRMSPDVTRYMNTNPKLTLEEQRKWLMSFQSRDDVQYWLIEQDDVPVGVINLADMDYEKKSTSWGYYIGERKYRSLFLAISLEMSLYDYVFDVLGFEELHNEVFSLNAGVVKLHVACGSHIVGEVKGEVEKEGIKYDVTHISISKEDWEAIRLQKQYEHIDFDMTFVPHHIGYAVKDIGQAVGMYQQLGWYQNASVYDDEEMQVRIAFMINKHDGSCLELIAPLSGNSPVSNILKQMKNVSSPYHICYAVKNLEEGMAKLKKRGFIMVRQPSAAAAFQNRRVAFLLSKYAGMVELVENE